MCSSDLDETAFAVRALLTADGAATPGRNRRVRFTSSGDPEVFRTLGARFLGPEVRDVEAWTWT